MPAKPPLLLPFVALALGACSSGNSNVPPGNALYFPTGVALDPDPALHYLYVTNGNTDLRYSGGTFAVLDTGEMERAYQTYAGGTVPSGCAPSPFTPAELDCDASSYVARQSRSGNPFAAVEVGNFAGEIQVEPIAGAGKGLARRVFFPVRGDPSVTFVDVYLDATTGAITNLQCTAQAASGGGVSRCDESHKLDYLTGRQVPLPDEPFGLYLDASLGYLYVSHQFGGYVTLISAPANGDPPQLVDTHNGLVAADTNGNQAAFEVAARTPGQAGGLVYVTSRSTPTYGVFRVADQQILPFETAVPLGGLRVGADLRGLAFADGGDRALILDRQPSSLVVVDTSLDQNGLPRNRVTSATAVCSSPSFVVPHPSAAGLRAYIVCFADSQVWDVDVDAGRVISQIPVPVGPNNMALQDVPGLPQRLYVADFSDSSVAVIDTDASSPTFDEVVLKVGTRPVNAR